MSEPKLSETKPKKMVRRSVAIALGIVCIVLIAIIAYFSVTGISAQNSYNNLQNQNNQLQAWLDGNETLLNQMETWIDGNITYYNSEISSLGSQIANLTNKLNSLMNGTGTLGVIVSNPHVWVNKTVVVQGVLNPLDMLVYTPWQTPPLWNILLVSSDGISQIGVLWNGVEPNSSKVLIYGVVKQGLENLNGTDIIVFYIKAETMDPI